jgi:uncharacterized repeat protein (TIGR01451 family)
MRNWIVAAVLAALAIPSVSAPASAQERGQPNPLSITAENLMAADEQHQELADPNTALPGDVILYRLTFTNTTEVPVRSIEFKDPLPGGLHYVDGSATADRDDVTITFSIDGGQTYVAEPLIEKVIDGERRTVPAPPEMFTHVRWLVSGWVEPGAQVTAEFKAQLPAPNAPEEPGEPSEGPGRAS